MDTLYEKVLYELFRISICCNMVSLSSFLRSFINLISCSSGIEIEHVPSFNFLGIMLDENLSWKSHIEMVGNKISKVTGIL